MMPPLVRRCPECGHVGWSRRFVATDDGTRVACPACGCRFTTRDDPRLR